MNNFLGAADNIISKLKSGIIEICEDGNKLCVELLELDNKLYSDMKN